MMDSRVQILERDKDVIHRIVSATAHKTNNEPQKTIILTSPRNDTYVKFEKRIDI